MIFHGKCRPLTVDDLATASVHTLNIRPEVLWSVIKVETSGCGYRSDRRVQMLFERHIFHRLTGGKFDKDNPSISAATTGGYGSTAKQYDRLEAAMLLDEEAALKSASWGLGQIMGFNHKRAGYDSVQGMVNDFRDSERAQLLAMVKVIISMGLADELAHQEWTLFALTYNGPSQKGYDDRLKKAYDDLMIRGLPDFQVRAEQMKLMFDGFYKGAVDGLDGPQTRLARAEALASKVRG